MFYAIGAGAVTRARGVGPVAVDAGGLGGAGPLLHWELRRRLRRRRAAHFTKLNRRYTNGSLKEENEGNLRSTGLWKASIVHEGKNDEQEIAGSAKVRSWMPIPSDK